MIPESHIATATFLRVDLPYLFLNTAWQLNSIPCPYISMNNPCQLFVTVEPAPLIPRLLLTKRLHCLPSGKPSTIVPP